MDVPDTLVDIAHDDVRGARPDGAPAAPRTPTDPTDATAPRWAQATPVAQRRPVGNPRRVRL